MYVYIYIYICDNVMKYIYIYKILYIDLYLILPIHIPFCMYHYKLSHIVIFINISNFNNLWSWHSWEWHSSILHEWIKLSLKQCGLI